MASGLRLEWDRRVLDQLKARGLERALFRTLRKAGGDALRVMRTDGSRYVRKRKTIKAGAIRDALSLRYPKSAADLQWSLIVSAKPVPLIAYSNRQVKSGVSVSVNRGVRKIVKGAFLATMKSGHQGIFKRRGKGRLPIKELYSSRVIDVFRDAGMIPATLQRAQVTFRGTFDRLLPLEVTKLVSGSR